MILNVFTLTVVFGSSLTLVLLIIGSGSALSLSRRSPQEAWAENKIYLENRGYLVFLLVAAALVGRVLNWPLFYLMLHSFIPDVPGAMCIYGTTQVMPLLIRFLEVLKPISFFLVGAWFIEYLFVDEIYWVTPGTRMVCQKNKRHGPSQSHCRSCNQ